MSEKLNPGSYVFRAGSEVEEYRIEADDEGLLDLWWRTIPGEWKRVNACDHYNSLYYALYEALESEQAAWESIDEY